MNLSEVGDLAEGFGVTQGNVDYSVMGKSRYRVEGSGFLPSTRPSGGCEDAGVFSVESARGPQLTGGIPEGLDGLRSCQMNVTIQERWISYLPLGGHRTVTGGDTKEEGIE